MENIKIALIGFIILTIIAWTAYSISSKVLIVMGLTIVGIIGIVSLAFLAFIVGEVFLNMWKRIRGVD